MKKYSAFNLLLSTLFLLIPLSINAQQTALYNDPENHYRQGLDLFTKEKYSAAQEQFSKVINETRKNSEINTNAFYYQAICAAKLLNENAEYLIANFINEHPSSAKVERAYFHLGKIQFNNHDYYDALESYNKARYVSLSRDERIEYNFKKGFCHLQKEELPEAKRLLATVKDGNNKYSKTASYYYGHIAYKEKDFEEALNEFNKLSNDRYYSKVIPFYELHIYYHQGKYDKILETGPELLERAKSKKKAEIARLIGDAYYRNGDYEKAMEYLDIYKNTARHSLSREDNYQIGFTYFQNQRYDDAIFHFQDVIKEKDSLSQNAYYHLADCYIKTGKKKFASNAFLSAYKLDFDKEIKENALFNYAKLSIEVAHDPYNESIKSLEQYINEYPNSDRLEEAYNLLVELFLSTNNYKAALESIEKIKNLNTKLKKAYQKITYLRGIELFNNGHYQKSIGLFKTATDYDYNTDITTESNYWMGEAFYQLGNYWGAMKYYNIFLQKSNAQGSPNYSKAFYNLGYTYFKRKDYSDAVSNFKKFIRNRSGEPEKLVNDAFLRLGDCYFISKRYETAIKYYNESLSLNYADIDYALYQKAMSYGALGKHKDKVNTLDRLVRYYRNSPYADNALYEMAITELILNDNRSALVHFDKIVKQYPKSNLVKKSLLKTGLIYYNNDQNMQAIRTLKQVAEKYPNTAESREALASLKNIYIDMNKVDEYFDYTRNMPDASISTTEQDSLTYIAAENQYMNNNCDEALPAFKKYIDKFPYGAFIISAHYYKADCELRRDSLKQALEDYTFVVDKPKTAFTENALLHAARISNNLNMYESAYEYFKGLEEHAENNTNINFALEGQMQSAFEIKNYDDAIESALKLLKNSKVNKDQMIEAHYILGKSYMAQNNLNKASSEFDITRKLAKNEKGAESAYYNAYIEYEQGNYKEAENLIFNISDEFSSYDYWMAKSFILLSDVYVAMDNIFQAKQTLQSIIDNYQGEELRQTAKEKLAEIKQKEEQQKQEINY